ncbi:MAG TPA: chromate efflux transporter [Solirubrobacteraceae bacterium]|nr:chromate efflux transporter [Solirubrobacteraceae bacterium]
MPSLVEIAREWGRIGCTGFGGPPAHISMLRDLCLRRRGWLSEEQFERAVAAVQVLPGPASTQLAIYCAWRLRGNAGALVGGVCFIAPGLVAILALSALLFTGSPPSLVLGAAAGAAAAVAAVAVRSGLDIALPMLARSPHARLSIIVYGLLGGLAAALTGPWLVLVLLGCGAIELARRTTRGGELRRLALAPPSLASLLGPRAPGTLRGAGAPVAAAASTGGTAALVWTAVKVGALSFGGGFVIIPLMQSDAVSTYHWMTSAQFANAVALGQLTPGPVLQTVAAVGFAAGGLGGGLLAALVAFTPSFAFVMLGAEGFERRLDRPRMLAFLAGAAPAAAGAIIGVAVPLAGDLKETWQLVVLAGAAVLLLAMRGRILTTMLLAALAGTVVALFGGPLPG